MRVVDIKTLKNKLRECIRLASQGETVLITDRDRVVAEITAPATGRVSMLTDPVLVEAVREGWMIPPLARRHLPPRNPIAPLEEILADLSYQRSDR